MARLESIRYVSRRAEVHGGRVQWLDDPDITIERLPQLFWENQTTWGEVNMWALEQASGGSDIKTVQRNMQHMLSYMKWLEQEGVGWWHFPEAKRERCLNRFRGYVVRMRDAGEVAPSTASARMATVIRFYRWLKSTGLLSISWPMWAERQVGIRLTNVFGLEHTLRVTSTDLSISNIKVAGAISLEDGLMPLTIQGMREIIDFADAKASEELALMLRVGFGTGLRLGSILDLKVTTLENARLDPLSGWYKVAVGPRAHPPVATKFNISGMVPIPALLLERLREYAHSTRRLKRQALAARENRGLLFLNRFGVPYSGEASRAINVQMSRLRDAGEAASVSVLREFHFHRTRPTFATALMRVALKFLPVGEAVQLVRESCLHKNEATTMKYVKFIEINKAMAEAADAFSEAFMGLVSSRAPNA